MSLQEFPDPTLSPGQVLSYVSGTLRDSGEIWVIGEIVGLGKGANGAPHLYWKLNEGQASLSCAAIGRNGTAITQILDRAGIKLTNGLRVRVGGTLDVYQKTSTVQLNVYMIDPIVSVGESVLLRRKLKQALLSENIFNAQKDLKINSFPLGVVVIGPSGQGLEDFVGTLRSSPWDFDLKVSTAPAEGAGAPEAIARAIAYAELENPDLVVLTRGGGSGITSTYDQEVLVRAICKSKIPVAVAVGHTTDLSLADEVAWGSLITPTAAGEWLCGILEKRSSEIEEIISAIDRQIESQKQRLGLKIDAEVKAVDRAVEHTKGRDQQQIELIEAKSRSDRRVKIAVGLIAVLAIIILILIIGGL